MVKQAAKAKEQKDGDTEARILHAARAVFIRRGTAGARMQEIAEEAGVNQALLHYYFRSKERLSEAVFRETAGRMFPILIGTLGSDASIDEKIERIVDAYLDNLSRSPFLPGYVISELHHHPERGRSVGRRHRSSRAPSGCAPDDGAARRSRSPAGMGSSPGYRDRARRSGRSSH